MVSVVSSRTALVPFVLLSVARHLTEAHTWIDCFDTDSSKLYDQSASYIFGGAGGNGFCAGYGAGYPGRGETDIGTEYTHKVLKNDVEAGAPVCEDVGTNTYSDWRKRLSVVPGQTAYFAYLPNGHIVKDKKGVGSQHGVYWTGQVGTSLKSTLDMKPENLLDGHTMDYDDGRCGETFDYNGNPSNRAGDGKPCIGSFVVPAGTAPGIYSMVWYWTFWLDNQSAYKDQEMAKGYFGAAYSTCFEVEVTSGDGGNTSTTQQPGTVAPYNPTQGLVGAEADPMAPTPPPAVTPAPAPAPTPPIVQAAAPPAEIPAATPSPTAPAAPPAEVPAGSEVTPAPTVPEATPAPTSPEATPAPDTPPAEVPAAPEVTPAPAVLEVTPAPTAPMETPAPTTPIPETPATPTSGSTSSVCRRRMRS
ncbi:hypothetical protein PF005_g8996 [Phytophthora fragariae]|uniref:DUF7492 domain-containing protein n=2 Tax=Phytophthora fragariae TaxID=53985 RepID=A0A6A3SIZ7_9STRA|nr:hypothetical protein PF003_g29380 [Phytophthora fragariae]KAE8940714.1 hypothetical protein PF009_g9487 [Phytophthora fragariae]KAE9014574.1 hypothetical protein PF011_g7981 [Phytophthora fragariae]KAE9118073.1 hypothetical protein PF010_g8355 [Phytophthora fragariae]KAE9118092.1 hypothetical protein PF007_g9054 [Phytophthora fragariae]